MLQAGDTIAAIATPPGRGGVGIVRISGPLVQKISSRIIGWLPEPKFAKYCRFRDDQNEVMDEGIGIYFPMPASFTGEDVLELQGHGGPVIMDMLLQQVLRQGARLARPGEFSERAFLNGKLDLTQAEAIADLIDADTRSSARLACRTLQGVFSNKVHQLVEKLIHLRLYVESAIDFPEEEIDFLSDGKVSTDLQSIIDELRTVQQSAHTGRLLRDGISLVIAGRPNSGKSSLLNALAGADTAIVTEIPGTTRDLLRERIQIDGMPVHIIDTAGLRKSDDPVEIEGMRRARVEIAQADQVLWVFDDRSDPDHLALDRTTLPADVPLTLVRNKIDLSGKEAGVILTETGAEISLSAKQGQGIDLLKKHLKESVGLGDASGGEFSARRRHLVALEQALHHLLQGLVVLEQQSAGELLAEELRMTQQVLGEITGEFSADDLLGRIFSTFCIGK